MSDVSVLPGWIQAFEKGRFSIDTRRHGVPAKLTPRQPSAHAPPALTFGLPGKQSVKGMGAERDLMRLWKTLAEVWPMRPRELRQLHGWHRRVAGINAGDRVLRR
ncbi:hypothetical protein J2W51_003957 [Tardiphaga robiniae]|uniref:hypothetical protein n=1 Tax=Tardiphaga robiniae TaxID=943830 RepID=UPI0028639425|nr:hypothetical protein [Tardiphaga robiniae]MDR6661371.1 hypothetical protein [Tardiphaga robiniae]